MRWKKAKELKISRRSNDIVIFRGKHNCRKSENMLVFILLFGKGIRNQNRVNSFGMKNHKAEKRATSSLLKMYVPKPEPVPPPSECKIKNDWRDSQTLKPEEYTHTNICEKQNARKRDYKPQLPFGWLPSVWLRAVGHRLHARGPLRKNQQTRKLVATKRFALPLVKI